MATQKTATAAELQAELDRIGQRLAAIGGEVGNTSDLERLQALAQERATLEQAQRGIGQRVQALQAQEREAQEAAKVAANAAELARVTKDLDKAFATMRDLVEKLDAVTDTYWVAARRYVALGGPSTRPAVSADLGRVVKAQVRAWAAFDRIPQERKEREARGRKARLAELERQERLAAEREKEAERLREQYPWAAVNTDNWTPPIEQETS